MKMTLYVTKPDNPKRVAYERILNHYGAGCYPKEPQERDDFWYVPLEAFPPSRVIDEKTGSERTLTFHLSDVGEIWIRKSTLTIERASSLSSVRKNISARKADIRRLVEKDLIKIIGDPQLRIRFGKMKFALFGLQPIYRTVISLLGEQYPTFGELEQMGYLDLANLIINLGYASYSTGDVKRLVPTNKLYELYNWIKSETETAEAFLGLILANYYDYLSETMRIIHFVPYVRVSTSYYGDAVQFGKLIHLSENRLRENAREYYKGAPQITVKKRFGMPTIIKELAEAGVLRYDGTYITGTDDIFQRLIPVRDQLPITEEPFNF